MSIKFSKRRLGCTYFLYHKETGCFVAPVTIWFWSKSTTPRNLCDIAARIARQEDIDWDKMVIATKDGVVLTERTRMRFNQ